MPSSDQTGQADTQDDLSVECTVILLVCNAPALNLPCLLVCRSVKYGSKGLGSGQKSDKMETTLCYMCLSVFPLRKV